MCMPNMDVNVGTEPDFAIAGNALLVHSDDL